MSYNLLLDTEFKNNNWKFINCKFENGYLISSDNIFGIYQELILPDPTKLYFRCKYQTNNISIKTIKIGIQNKDILFTEQKQVKFKKKQKLSLIDYAKQEKIKIHIIFESNTKINKVLIEEPLLVNLDFLNKSFWLKSILDKTLKFYNGYSYKNLYCENEITINNPDFNQLNIEQAKIGIINTIKETEKIQIKSKFIKDKYYLVKLDFEEINKYGNIYFNYGCLKSETNNEQLYFIFKAIPNEQLFLNINNKEKFNYLINIKHLMILDITNLKLIKEDIPYLPYI